MKTAEEGSKMLGKFLIGRKTSVDGKPLTIICGVVKGHHIVNNDNFNAVLIKMNVLEHKIVDDDIEMSPEDFLELNDDIDWTKEAEVSEVCAHCGVENNFEKKPSIGVWLCPDCASDPEVLVIFGRNL